MREIIVSKLFQELLGPRNGIREEFNSSESPSLEFITGILSPVETLDETWWSNGTVYNDGTDDSVYILGTSYYICR